MASADNVTVRQSKPDEVKYLMEFMKENKSDYTMYDYRSFMRLDPTFLLVAVDNIAGQPVGFAGLCLCAPAFYYFGNFIVRKDCRGQGVGRKLWKAMLAKAGDNAIELDAVSDMVDWYTTNGFKFQLFKVNMYEILLNEEMKLMADMKSEVHQLSDEDWPSLIEYDRHVYANLNRETILRAWFTDEVVKVYIARREGVVVGYGSIHKQTDSLYALRHVSADNEDVLEEILRSMFEGLSVGTNVKFWIIDNKPFPKYLKSAGKSTESATRLCTKRMKVNTKKLWI